MKKITYGPKSEPCILSNNLVKSSNDPKRKSKLVSPKIKDPKLLFKNPVFITLVLLPSFKEMLNILPNRKVASVSHESANASKLTFDSRILNLDYLPVLPHTINYPLYVFEQVPIRNVLMFYWFLPTEIRTDRIA